MPRGRADGEGGGDALVRRRAELAGASFEAAVAAAQAHVERTGATLVHAFEDERVIAGQGTIGLELAEQAPGRGDGSVPDRRRRARGRDLARAEGAPARGAHRRRRLQAGTHDRGRDRREASAASSPSSILERTLDDTVEVSDEEISEALVLCLERTKLLVEGAGAVGLAALLAGRAGRHRAGRRRPLGREHRRDDADPGPAARPHEAGRFLAIRMLIPDRPGELRNVLDLIAAGPRQRRLRRPPPRGQTTTALQTEVEIVVSTRDEAHCEELLETLRAAGYVVERLGPPA